MTSPNFDDLYGAPKPQPAVRGQKPQGQFDDLYTPPPQTPEEHSFAQQLDELMSSPLRPTIGPIPGPIWQPGTSEDAPPSIGPAEHQGSGWDLLGFGKELVRDPVGTIYNMVGRPIVHTLFDKQSTSSEQQTAMLATMFPASQIANPELQQLTSRVRDDLESRRQTLGLIASAAGGAAGEMAGLAGAGKLPSHIVSGGMFSTLAAGYDTEQATKNLKMIVAIGGPTAVLSSVVAKALGRLPIPIDNVRARAAAIREARAVDPIRAQEEPATSGMKPMPATEGRGFEVTGERVTPPVVEGQPTLAEMTGMAALQHERPTTTNYMDRVLEAAYATKPDIWNPNEFRGVDRTRIQTEIDRLESDAKIQEARGRTLDEISAQGLANLRRLIERPAVSEITPEEQLTQPPAPTLYDNFSSYSRSIDEHPEVHSPDVPNVSDIKDKYPGAYYRALEYDDPNEAMFQFADQLSTQVENREISPDIAESLGGRFKAYLDARQSVLLKNSFSARVQAFARMNGIPDAEYDALYKEMADRVGEELRQRHLEPDEYSAYHEIAARVRQSILTQHAIRLGEIDKEGAHFSEPGPSTYYDPENADVKFYAYPDAKIADITDPAVRVQLYTQAIKDHPELANEPDFAQMLQHEEHMSYIIIEHYDLATSAKKLGYDGIRFFEGDDIDIPTTVNIWNLDKVRAITREQAGYPTVEAIAASNAMIVEPAATGEVVRDATSGELLARTTGPEETRQFIQESGQAAGISLDGGGDKNSVPPSAIAGDAMPPQTPPPRGVNRVDDELTWRPPDSNWMEKVIGLYRGVAARWNIKVGFYNEIDRMQHTQLAAKFFYPLNEALMRIQAHAQPWREAVHDIWKESRGLAREQLDKVTTWLGSISADELIKGNNEVGRPANEREINTANLIVHSEVDDLSKLLKFARLSAEIRANFKPEFVENEINLLRTEYNLTPAEENIAGVFEAMRSFSPDQWSIGTVVRLADSIKHDTPSRGEYMAKNQFTPQMVKVAHLWDDFYREISDLTGIDSKKLLQSYFPHYRANPDAPSLAQAYLFQHGGIPDRTFAFANDKIRTGEIDAYERDPNVAAMRYVNALFKDRFLNPVLEQAIHDANAELKLLDPRTRDKIKLLMEAHLRNVNGRVDMMSAATQDAFEKTLTSLNVRSEPNFRRKVVDTFSTLIYGAGVSFRAQLVLRHINQLWTLGFAEYGTRSTMQAFEHLASLATEEGRARFSELRAQGKIPGLGTTPFTERAEESNVLGSALNKADEWSRNFARLGMAGVRGVYDVSHFMWFEEGRARALRELNLWHNKQKSFQSALDDMQLGKYKLGVQQRVVEYARNGKISAAADVVGQATGDKVTFHYGNANAPHGWETNAGRLIGTFGVWPAHMQDYTFDMMSRGTLKQRVGKMARFAMAQGAVFLTGKSLGLNMTPFYMGPGFFFEGDIFRGLAETASPLAVWAGGPFIGLANTVLSSVKEPNHSLREYARTRLMRQILTGFIPGRGAFTDVSKAIENTNDYRYDDLVYFLARVAGVKPSDVVGWFYGQ